MKYVDRCWASNLKSLDRERELNKIKSIIARVSAFLFMGLFCYFTWLDTITLGAKIARNWSLIKYTMYTVLN